MFRLVMKKKKAKKRKKLLNEIGKTGINKTETDGSDSLGGHLHQFSIWVEIKIGWFGSFRALHFPNGHFRKFQMQQYR